MDHAPRNAQYNWNTFDVHSYLRHNYSHLLWEDRVLARFAIGALLEMGIEPNSLMNAIDICNGGVLRGPLLIAPFMNPNGTIIWADYGEPQLNYAQDLLTAGKQGNLGIWEAHQQHMEACHPAWASAGLKACQMSKVAKQNIFTLPAATYDIGITCFGPESLTQSRSEWKQAVRAFLQTIKTGHVALMLYMVNSTGYSLGGQFFPAIPVSQEDVLREVSHELKDIQAFFVPAETMSVRVKDDPHGYDGMAGIVGRRK